jgi:toxin CcdB
LADSFGDPVMRLNPRVIVDGQAYLLLTQYVAAVPTNELRQFVGNLRPDQDHIKLALGLIFYGF